jgi:hypothetical protein
MLDDNGIFKIDSSCSHSKLGEIHNKILENIKDIKMIEISEDEALQSSALLSLLKTIKQSKPDIAIPLIENESGKLFGLGNFVIMDRKNNDDV